MCVHAETLEHLVSHDKLSCLYLVAAVPVKTTRSALPLMESVQPVLPAGTVRDVTSRVRQVITVTAARTNVHGAGITSLVTQKLGNV